MNLPPSTASSRNAPDPFWMSYTIPLVASTKKRHHSRNASAFPHALQYWQIPLTSKTQPFLDILVYRYFLARHQKEDGGIPSFEPFGSVC